MSTFLHARSFLLHILLCTITFRLVLAFDNTRYDNVSTEVCQRNVETLKSSFLEQLAV